MNVAIQQPNNPRQANEADWILDVARGIGRSVATGIIERIKSFPSREESLISARGQRFASSLPEQILWDGLGEEAAPVFVVYKLIHEAFSNAPHFFRLAFVEFMRAQPKRFSACFSRETIWAALASYAGFDSPGNLSHNMLCNAIHQAGNMSLWWRSEAEIRREADCLFKQLENGRFQSGFVALKALQSEKARGIACGKLLLAVPARLAAYAGEVIALTGARRLPPLEELNAYHEKIALEGDNDARHESIPLDLLFTTLEDDLLHIYVLARTSAGRSQREDLRRRSIYIRYFLRKAFAGYEPEKLSVKLAFYLDREAPVTFTHGDEKLFHPGETIGMETFWEELCPAVNPDKLLATIRNEAAAVLISENIVRLIRTHFSAPRPAKTRPLSPATNKD